MRESSINPTTAKKQGFFSLDLAVINDIVADGATAEEAAAFIVLTRGTTKGNAISTHGANSVAARTGMTNYKANNVLEDLKCRHYIWPAEVVDGYSKKRAPRWRIREYPSPLLVPISNSLIDGIGEGKNNPPLARILNDVQLAQNGTMAEARLDTLVVMLHLYKYHSIADFGGIDPRSGVYQSWQGTENSNGIEVETINSKYSLVEIEPDCMHYQPKFANEALSYIENDDERIIRFLNAFENLKRFGIVYEVTQIWSDDPNKISDAEPLYTLYIHDRHARNSDPYLSREIHSAMLKLQIMDARQEFSCYEKQRSENIVESGRYRYFVNTKNGGFPIGIFRLRFRPGTKDTGKGMAAEQRRVDHWSEILSSIK